MTVTIEIRVRVWAETGMIVKSKERKDEVERELGQTRQGPPEEEETN
jgi:hypothetical protein